MTVEEGSGDLCDSYCPSYERDREHYRQRILEVAGISELFKALGDETRTKILYLLAEGELCVCDLADALAMSLPAVSHHLRLLKVMRLVRYRRQGKQAFYRLDDEHVVQLIEVALAHYRESRER
jgi:ArsR family transcriptional regulator